MSSSSTETVVDVPMPQMGVSVSEGTVVGWSKQVGDRVERDETVCEISTDKVDTECPAPADGVLVEILVEEGRTVEVGTVLARIAAEDVAAAPETALAGPPERAAASHPAGTRTGAARRYSPVVRRIAQQHDVDLSRVGGTGRNGRVTKKDVLGYIEHAERPLHSESPYRPDPAPQVPAAPPAAPFTAAPARPVELSRMRRSIGDAMRRSLDTAATCTTIVECDMTRIEARRRELGLTALPLVARHAIDTLREFSDLNATLEGTTLTRHDAIHLGIAVSLGDDGLIVPVIRNAQDLSDEGLARRIKELAGRARARQLGADDVRGATFTITNPGAYGALIATPIIDVPQVAILDLEAIVRRPVVVSDADGNESIAIRSMVNLCMSWDHRALDGAYAARFLTALRARIEGRTA